MDTNEFYTFLKVFLNIFFYIPPRNYVSGKNRESQLYNLRISTRLYIMVELLLKTFFTYFIKLYFEISIRQIKITA